MNPPPALANAQICFASSAFVSLAAALVETSNFADAFFSNSNDSSNAGAATSRTVSRSHCSIGGSMGHSLDHFARPFPLAPSDIRSLWEYQLAGGFYKRYGPKICPLTVTDQQPV